MNVEDFDYEVKCNACDGDGELPRYDPCPACYGDGAVHRQDDAANGCIRLYEGLTEEGNVTTTEIPISDGDTGGFEGLYGQKDINTIISEAEERENSETEKIFRNVKSELEKLEQLND